MMDYVKIFDVSGWPDSVTCFPDEAQGSADHPLGDRRGNLYRYTGELELAINIALVTARPLLIQGVPGSGKSTLARNVAKVLNWRYYEEVISTQTQARDLLWKVDLVKRLYHANAGTAPDDWAQYLEPGVLWWAFDPESAATCGAHSGRVRRDPTMSLDPGRSPLRRSQGAQEPDSSAPIPAVVLLDEIDKADPDLPNNLLLPLGALRFRVPELDREVRSTWDSVPLIILTTNDERALPDAFLRRCIIVQLKPPSPEELVVLAKHFFDRLPDGTLDEVRFSGRRPLYQRIACSPVFQEAEQRDGRPVSTAEFLDAVEVCLRWELGPDSTVLEQVLRATMLKPGGLEMENR